MNTVVDRMHQEFREVVGLLGNAEVSLRLTAEENFRKVLLLAAASLFEKLIQEQIVDLVKECSAETDLVTELVRRKAIERQFHTYFVWDGRNANVFFGLFGEDFKRYMTLIVQANSEFRDAIVAFLELGNDRNRLVHQDFGTFALEKTSDEVFALYLNAARFVESMPAHFRGYLASRRADV